MIKVIIADDSPLLRRVLSDVLENTGMIKVNGTAQNGKEAIKLIEIERPDVLILDCEMPVMNGLETLNKIMTKNPLPVFMFSSLTTDSAAVTVKALELGAIDFLLKPAGGINKLESIAHELIRKIRFVMTKGRFSIIKGKKGKSLNRLDNPNRKAPSCSKANLQELPSRKIDIIAIGSSTGGVQAAHLFIPKIIEDCKPIVWVQHMPPNFTTSFAENLNFKSKIRVKEGEDGEILRNGFCYLAPGGMQMRVVKVGPSNAKKNGETSPSLSSNSEYKLKIEKKGKISLHCPSCNYLFESVSKLFTTNALGVILTGMGEDGSEGLMKMHENGAYVIGQSERTCVVYGMPKAAKNIGVVDIELDINDMAEGICKVSSL